MAQSAIDQILASRRQAEVQPAAQEGNEPEKFFSVLIGEGVQEHFFEIQFSGGLRTCFAYSDLGWFTLDPETGFLDLDFGGIAVSIKGRGLGGRLFQSIKQKRVGWVREKNSEMEDNQDAEVFIDQITITPPENFAGEASE